MEADSITYRNRLWDEWQNTLLTRLQPGAAVIIILTRWHEDDLAGRILNFDKENWEIIRLPAVCEDEAGDPLGRRTGETLWPEKYDWNGLLIKSVKLAAMFGMRFISRNLRHRKAISYSENGGDITGKRLLRFDEIIQSWDCAFKDEQASDYVVGQVWGRRGADKYLLGSGAGQDGLPFYRAGCQIIVGKNGRRPGQSSLRIKQTARRLLQL